MVIRKKGMPIAMCAVMLMGLGTSKMQALPVKEVIQALPVKEVIYLCTAGVCFITTQVLFRQWTYSNRLSRFNVTTKKDRENSNMGSDTLKDNQLILMFGEGLAKSIALLAIVKFIVDTGALGNQS